MSSAHHIEKDFNIPDWAICRTPSNWFNCLVSKFPVKRQKDRPVMKKIQRPKES